MGDDQAEVERQVNRARVEDIKVHMQAAIKWMRQANSITGLRCRALSESITCAETAYLWLQQVPGNEVQL